MCKKINCSVESHVKTIMTNVYSENKINEGFILVNPDEIYDFVKDNKYIPLSLFFSIRIAIIELISII